MPVELNKAQFNSRVKRVYTAWNVSPDFRCIYKLISYGHTSPNTQSAKNDEDYSSIADTDALLLLAGDPAAEDEPMRKGTCFQVRTIVVS
jgi:hypothetical protein